MKNGPHQQKIHSLIQAALLTLLESGSDITLCIDVNRNIIFKRPEYQLIADYDKKNISFKSKEIEQLINSSEFIQNGSARTLADWSITPLHKENLHLGFIFQRNDYKKNSWKNLLKLSESVHSANSLREVAQHYAQSLSRLVGSKNICIVLFDPSSKEYSLAYHEDEKLEAKELLNEISSKSFANYVHISRKSLLIQKHDIITTAQEIGIEPTETVESWLGVPVEIHNKVIGTVIVRSYDENIRFTQHHKLLIEKGNVYLAEGITIFRALEETQRTKELLEVSNSMSKTCAFEYTPHNNCFLSINKALDCLRIAQKNDRLDFQSFFKEVDEGDRQKLEEAFLSLNEEGNSQIEHEIRLKDNKIVLKLFAFTPPKNLAHRTSILGVIQDITQLKQNEKILKMAYERVQKADQLKAEFMAALSYEVRTPINAIIGFSNLLGKPKLSEDERNEYFKVVQQNGNSLIQTIDNLVDISRLESGKVQIHKNPMNLNRLLDQILNYARKKIQDLKKPHLELVLHKSHSELLMMTDEARLSQILRTLVLNAITYTKEGYIQFGYHIIDRDEPLVEFFVKDTGSGIPQSKRQLIFQPYGRMEGNRLISPGETSLGLSIAKDLVRLMGGEMTVESEENQGTTFYFYLPLEPVEIAPSEKKNKIAVINKIHEKKPIRFLVAEDNINNYKLIEECFANSDLDTQFEFAGNGLEAIEKLRLQQFDIVLMDLKMPLMNGMQAGEYIRTKFPNPLNKIPIIALTADTLKETRRACLALGFNGFISKPFLPEELVRKVKEVLP